MPARISPPRNRISSDPLIQELVAVRVETGITQDTLTCRLGYCSGQIGVWERGSAVPDYQHLRDWANGLGMDIGLIPMDADRAPMRVRQILTEADQHDAAAERLPRGPALAHREVASALRNLATALHRLEGVRP